MKVLTLVLLLISVSAAAETPEEAILQVMRDAEAGWNAGDHETYMACYVKSDSLRFASGGTVTRGWKTTLARYAARYPDAATMGQLTFSDMDVTLLGDDAAYVFGRWELERAGDHPQGLFTLVFRRFDEGWRIVHDHTSSAD